MAALTDLSDLINRYTGGNSGAPESIWYGKGPRISGGTTAVAAGRLHSLWTFDGTYGKGTAPTTGAIPVLSTAGAVPFTNPAAGKQKWMTQLWAGTTTGQGLLCVYDRLYHIGNLSGTVTTAQTVQGSTPTPAITRYTSGVGVMAFVEIYTAIGSTATTVTCSYTNSSGTSGRTTTAVAIGGTGLLEVGRMIALPLQAGDKGIQSVQTLTLAGTTATTGAFGVTLAKPLAFINLSAPGMFAFRDFAVGQPGIPEVLTDACLAHIFVPQNTIVPELTMSGFQFVEA